MLLLISVDNELSRLPLFCILSEQAGCFLLGAEQHMVRLRRASRMTSGFPFSSEFHFLVPPFLMIYPQSLTAFGRKKSGNNDSGKNQCVCPTVNTRHSRSIGVLLPRKIKSQQQPASHGATILLTKTYKPDNVHRWIAPRTGQSTHAPSRGNCANSFTGKV